MPGSTWSTLFHSCPDAPDPGALVCYKSGSMQKKSMDAIVVPGGGVLADGSVPPWVENRLARVLETAEGEVPVVLLSAGTVYKPHPLDAAGRPIYESVAAAEWLKRRGLPARRICVETASYDTVGNAYFLRVIHSDPRGWRRLRIVSSEFHMARLQAVFGWVFGVIPNEPPYELEFEAVPDVGLTPQVRAVRSKKELSSLAAIRPTMARLQTLAAIHQWLFTEHEAYSMSTRTAPSIGLPEHLLDTY